MNPRGYWYRGCWYAESTLSIDYDHPALLYGASVFTTCRRYEGSIDHPLTMWLAHRDRLQSSLDAFGWKAPNWEQVLAGIQAVRQPVVRITIFPQGEELIFGRDLPEGLAARQQQGIVAQLMGGLARSLPHHKTGNYLAPWLARQQSGTEAILINTQGRWLETITGNLWGWDGQHWYSPAASTEVLPGIARNYLVQWLQSQGKIVNEQPWDAELVDRLIGLAYSNCVVQLMPIKLVQGQQDRYYNCQIWDELRSAFTGNRQKTF